MRMLQYALTYDMLSVAELASFELACRRAQLAELKHKDSSMRGSSADDLSEDAYLYMGTGETRGLLMINPALEDFVAAELHKEQQVMKGRRKLREERQLQSDRGGGGGGGGKDRHKDKDKDKEKDDKGKGKGKGKDD